MTLPVGLSPVGQSPAGGTGGGGRRIIVSGADAPYFPMLQGLHRSLEACGALDQAAFGVLDAGLKPPQRQRLEDDGAIVVVAEWGFDFPLRRQLEDAKPGFKAMTSRPLLPHLFPGYSTILWLDADLWLQMPDPVELFFAGAADGRLAAILELDRSYPDLRRGRAYWQRLQKWYATIAGSEIAFAMTGRPTINTGAFALQADAPHWQRWNEILCDWLGRQAAYGDAVFLLEQFALNRAIYLDRLPFLPLPTRCNWLCHLALPAWNPDTRLFCDPLPPHDPLGIVHVADWTKRTPLDVAGTDGETRKMWLTYPPCPPTAV